MFPWIGGKSRIKKWIIEKFPKHSCYVEVFGGAMWVLLAKTPARSEIYNDINSDLVNFWRELQTNGESLQKQLDSMLYSREIYESTLKNWKEGKKGKDNTEWAVNWFYLNYSTFNATLFHYPSWSSEKKRNSATQYYMTLEKFAGAKQRLKNVMIENMDFRQLIQKYDSQITFFYVDPPYFGADDFYCVKWKEQDHADLAELLSNIKGRFLLSYYDFPEITKYYPEEKFTYFRKQVYKKHGKKHERNTKGRNGSLNLKLPSQTITLLDPQEK